MKNERHYLPGFSEEVEKNMETMLDSLTSVCYNEAMNETEKALDCPECEAPMFWLPNGHIVRCSCCGHEEIL